MENVFWCKRAWSWSGVVRVKKKNIKPGILAQNLLFLVEADRKTSHQRLNNPPKTVWNWTMNGFSFVLCCAHLFQHFCFCLKHTLKHSLTHTYFLYSSVSLRVVVAVCLRVYMYIFHCQSRQATRSETPVFYWSATFSSWNKDETLVEPEKSRRKSRQTFSLSFSLSLRPCVSERKRSVSKCYHSGDW